MATLIDAINNAQMCTKWFINGGLDAALDGGLDGGLNVELE